MVKLKRSVEWPLLIIGSTGVAIFLVIVFSLPTDLNNIISYASTVSPSINFDQQSTVSSKLINSTSSIAVVPPASIGLPVRLKIAKIKVNAIIDSVGLTPQGAMGIPTIPSRAAWFNLGTRPGDIGSAVMSGHVNWYNNAYSIFLNLNKLKPGDKITVQDNKGAIISFVVRKSVIYGTNQDATNIFYSNDGLAHLNLITCSGTWNKIAKQYSNRLVVFTDRE